MEGTELGDTFGSKEDEKLAKGFKVEDRVLATGSGIPGKAIRLRCDSTQIMAR